MADGNGKKPRNTEGLRRGGGRPKGALNKTTRAAKEAIAEAAEELGGVDRLVAWVREDERNERIFWGTVYPRLLPIQAEVSGTDGGAIVHEIRLTALK